MFAAAPVPRPSPELAIRMTPAGQTLISQFRGKVVVLALISTTCPHCQALTGKLNALHAEFAPKGVQFLAAAFNPMSNMLVGDFIKTYHPVFPVGWVTRETTLEYLQHSEMVQLYVPSLVFIDRQGIIRHQFLGDDPFFQNQDQNLRQTIEEMLKMSAAKPAAPAAKKTATAAAKKAS